MRLLQGPKEGGTQHGLVLSPCQICIEEKMEKWDHYPNYNRIVAGAQVLSIPGMIEYYGTHQHRLGGPTLILLWDLLGSVSVTAISAAQKPLMYHKRRKKNQIFRWLIWDQCVHAATRRYLEWSRHSQCPQTNPKKIQRLHFHKILSFYFFN